MVSILGWNPVAAFRSAVLGKPSSPEQLTQFLEDRLSNKDRGIAFGEIHGHYAFPLFIRDNMALFARQGVKRLYVEMIPSKLQSLLDQWYEDQDPTGIVEYINGFKRAQSAQQWYHYWLMFEEAYKQGIKVIALDKHEWDPWVTENQRMAYRNEHWIDRILEDQDTAPKGSKFIVYCGQAHIKTSLHHEYCIASRLGISGVFLESGDNYRWHRYGKPLKRYQINLPSLPHQDPVFGVPTILSKKISLDP